MERGLNAVEEFAKPDYGYGNRPHIEVIRILPHAAGIDPHASLDTAIDAGPLFSEAQLEAKVGEVVDNYYVAFDPESAEDDPKHFGMTIANEDALQAGEPAILMISTNGSNLYDEAGKPNNEGNALEIAYMAFKYPDKPIVYVESMGNGNSVDFSEAEYATATKDGKLVYETRDHAGHIVGQEAFETLQALARTLASERITISHIAANASGAHIADGFAVALPENSLERAFLYNTTNISDRNGLALAAGNLWEILMQRRYERRSKDPLRLTPERREMALKRMSAMPKRKLDLIRAGTHNPRKLNKQNQIFKHGNRQGQAAAVHAVAAQNRHANLRQTFVFPEFAAQYKSPEDFHEFMRSIKRLGGSAVEMSDLESLQIPMGQYGHTHYPTVWETLMSYSFNRP